jgi:hypothetical protein
MTDKIKIKVKNMDEENKNTNTNDEIDELVEETGEIPPAPPYTKGAGDESDGNIVIPKSKAVLMRKILQNIKEASEQLARLFGEAPDGEEEQSIAIGQLSDEGFKPAEEGEAKIIEGVFDGEQMIGPDGKTYSVPTNYASKSKLVEGDIMKLTITVNGTFIYKQIGPIERTRVIGILEKQDEGVYFVATDGKRWRILTASVTYYRGEPGDETVIMIPKTGESKWAAVENVVKGA